MCDDIEVNGIQYRRVGADEYNYDLKEMPNCTKKVGDVCKLTFDVSALLDGTNEGFMKAETLIRGHVWKAAQAALQKGKQNDQE